MPNVDGKATIANTKLFGKCAGNSPLSNNKLFLKYPRGTHAG